ncbi:MAG TPA: hypothetical protein PLH18_12765, partial [Clostridia bacterium]|nr:hypothetical protein [Clostridia bacterium]
VLIKELQSLALDINVYTRDNNELIIGEDDFDDAVEPTGRKDIDDLFINELVVEPEEIEGMTIEDLD